MKTSPSERSLVIREACAGDESLRNEVMSLVAAARDEDETSAADSLRAVILAQARALSSTHRKTDVDTLRNTLKANLGATYDILSTLGVGGMGAVFLAHERALDRYVAIKVLRAEQAVTANSQERFRREARIAAQLSHPGILPLHAFGEVGGMWYLVMGYVRGQSLAQRMHAEGRLPSNEVWRIMRALAEALEHAHQRQVIHRDIKPANILIDGESSRPMLADFGISKVLGEVDALTHPGDMLGTPHFMSPEQIANPTDCDARSDVYSLGAVAYAMLSGRSPSAEMASANLLSRRATSVIVPLERVSPSIAPDFAAVVMRCLAARREDRWASARALRDALDRVDQSIDAAVPPALREVAGFGAYAVLWMTFWLVRMLGVQSAGHRAILVLISLLVPLGLALHVANVASPSLRRVQFAKIAFWPPLWWSMWWPLALRRPGDVWKRLPWPAKTARLVMSAFTALLPVLTISGSGFAFIGQPEDVGGNWYTAVEILVAGALATLTGTIAWTRVLKLSFRDSLFFLLGSTAPSSFWERREIARLLHSATPGVRAPDPLLAADYVRAMEELQRTVSADTALAIERPTALTRSVVSAIADLDREIAALERDAAPSEFARLSARLSTLHSASPIPGYAEQHLALTELVNSEIALLRQFQERRILAQNESSALFDLLRALWRELQLLADSASDHTEPAARIATLLERGSELLAKQTKIA